MREGGDFGSALKEKRPFWGNRYFLLLFLFISAFSLKLFVFLALSKPIIFLKYPFFADQINKGIDIGERILDLSPFYLYAMVLLQKIYGPNWEAMLAFQLLAGSLTIVFIYMIGEKIFNRTVGLTAAILLMLYGNMILFEVTLEPDVFTIFLNSLFVLTLLWAKEKNFLKSFSPAWLLAGLILGLSVITKANALLLLPVAAFWICWTLSGEREKIQATLILLLGASLVVLPITLRNYAKFHDYVLVTADMGKVFFHGNGPGATGLERADLPDQGFIEESGQQPDYAHVLFRETARKRAGSDLKPSECSRYWIFQTQDHILAHPYSALKLFAKKFLLFWMNYEAHDLDTTYAYYQAIRTWPLIPFGLISALGIMGIVLIGKKFKQIYWPVLMVLVYLLTIIMFFNASRYRLPAVPFLSLMAAYGLIFLMNQFKRKNFKKGFLILGSVILLLFLSIFYLKEEVEALDRWQQATRIHYNLGGNVHLKKREYKEAIEEYKKAITLAPNFAPAYNQMGKVYALLNDMETAEKYFLMVTRLAPDVDQGYMNLGFIYKLKGDASRARSFFEKAYSINPRNIKVQEQLKNLKKLAVN